MRWQHLLLLLLPHRCDGTNVSALVGNYVVYDYGGVGPPPAECADGVSVGDAVPSWCCSGASAPAPSDGIEFSNQFDLEGACQLVNLTTPTGGFPVSVHAYCSGGLVTYEEFCSSTCACFSPVATRVLPGADACYKANDFGGSDTRKFYVALRGCVGSTPRGFQQVARLNVTGFPAAPFQGEGIAYDAVNRRLVLGSVSSGRLIGLPVPPPDTCAQRDSNSQSPPSHDQEIHSSLLFYGYRARAEWRDFLEAPRPSARTAALGALSPRSTCVRRWWSARARAPHPCVLTTFAH